MNRLFEIFNQTRIGRRQRQPNPDQSSLGFTESFEPGAVPESSFQKLDDQYRVAGSVAAAGDNIILTRRNNYDAEVIEMTFIPTSAVTLQLKTGGGQLISGAWPLGAGQPWSAPGIIVSRSDDLVLNLSVAVSVSYEVRWRPCYGR